jgi:hypothetical protein
MTRHVLTKRPSKAAKLSDCAQSAPPSRQGRATVPATLISCAVDDVASGPLPAIARSSAEFGEDNEADGMHGRGETPCREGGADSAELRAIAGKGPEATSSTAQEMSVAGTVALPSTSGPVPAVPDAMASASAAPLFLSALNAVEVVVLITPATAPSSVNPSRVTPPKSAWAASCSPTRGRTRDGR